MKYTEVMSACTSPPLRNDHDEIQWKKEKGWKFEKAAAPKKVAKGK